MLGFHTFLWPHLAWYAARTSPDPHRVERASLTIDSAFGGLWVALMHFNLLPSVLIVAMMSMDKIGWGPSFLARTATAMAAACGFGMLFTGFAVEPTTNMREINTGDEQGCLIVDIRMPGMSVVDLIEALQNRSSTLPAIVMTGHTDERSVRRLGQLRTIGLLKKPFSVTQLKEMLGRAGA